MKRLFDFIIVVGLIIIFSSLLVIIFFILKFFYKTKPIYFSKRIGRYNKIFLMPKFRTMLENAPQISTDKINKKFITPFGYILRKTSLDELPQLYSVLIGDMSLVGPRPALYNQKYLIKLRIKKNIHSLYPGITGWAQINGRDLISIQKKVKFDYFYLKNHTLIFDVKIIFLTIIKVLSYKDIKH